LTGRISVHTLLNMPKAIRYDRHSPREFSGQRDAQIIVDFLNGSIPDPKALAARARRSVLNILTQTRELLQTLKDTPGAYAFGKFPREIHGKFLALNRALAQYTTSPIFYHDQSSRQWSVGNVSNPRHSPIEDSAVHGIVRLADQNLLNRLQQCGCGNWMFARFSHQRFCSEACRVNFWEGQEERKERKRKQARENYLYKKAHSKSARRRK
jgi:hypothetical protein